MLNPCEFIIRIKQAHNSEPPYYVGNSNMDVNLKDSVVFIHPPTDGNKYGKLIIKRRVDMEKYEDERPKDDFEDDSE